MIKISFKPEELFALGILLDVIDQHGIQQNRNTIHLINAILKIKKTRDEFLVVAKEIESNLKNPRNGKERNNDLEEQ